MKLLRLGFFLVLALGGLVAASFDASAAEAVRKPNILVIVADDLGWGELGCQGNKQVPTPNIDSIAKGGVRFTSGYVSGPYCSPTRAGLMTGRYQQRFGHEFNAGPAGVAPSNFGLPLDEKTIADRLKVAGYSTGWFGKSHLGYAAEYHPLKRGFDEFYGFLGGAHDYLDAASDENNPILRGHEKIPKLEYTTETFANEAAAFISKPRSNPWFVYLAFNAVHAPLQALDKHLAKFENIKDTKRRTFCAMLSAMDDAVGVMLAKIREQKQEENTLIFFISDNGGPTAQTTSGNGPLRGFKSQTWEGGIRVAWLMQWKGRVPAGKVDDRPVIQLDILPTALAAAGVYLDPEWKLDGVNLLPYVTGEKTGEPHQALFWRFGQQIAVRMGDYKLVKAPGAGVETENRNGAALAANTADAHLYNLATDIGEKNNLAEQDGQRMRLLTALWNQWNSQLVEPKWGPRGADGKQGGGGKKKKKQ